MFLGLAREDEEDDRTVGLSSDPRSPKLRALPAARIGKDARYRSSAALGGSPTAKPSLATRGLFAV